MRESTILHPALLGQFNRYAKEVAGIEAKARAPGLFDPPTEADGLHGHTQPEQHAIRAFRMLGEAFALTPQGLVEWHALFARGEVPQADGALMTECLHLLPDLLLRARTLAMYQDRDGRAGVFIRVWQPAKALERLVDVEWAWRRQPLYRELSDRAPHLLCLMRGIHRLRPEAAALRHMRDLRHLLRTWGLSAAGWRWLVTNPALPPDVIEMLEGENERPAILLANALGAMGRYVAPPALFCGLVLDVLDMAQVFGDPPQDITWLIAAAWARFQALPEADRRDFINGSAYAVCLWVIQDGWEPDANQRRAGWSAIERACGKCSFCSDHAWPTPVKQVRHGGLVAVAIPDGKGLFDEGDAMSHCITDYILDAAARVFMPFSVRGPDGERIATFSFSRESDQYDWTPGQCSGQRNEKVVDPQVHELQLRVLELLNDDFGSPE